MNKMVRNVAGRYRSKFAALQTVKLTQAIKSKVNRELEKAGLDGNGRFEKPGLALSAIGNVLSANGIEFDEITNAHSLMGDKGRVTVDIAMTNQEDPFSPTSIRGTMVAMSWTKLGEYNYEAVAYLS
jgi:hypothetical protein